MCHFHTPVGFNFLAIVPSSFLLFFVFCLISQSSALAAPKNTALLQGLEKVTARTSTFQVALNTPHKFGGLEIFVRACDKTPPEERPEATAFLEIYDVKASAEPVSIFSGWMFASSPAVSAIQHPVYDIWVLDCVNELPPP